MCDGDMRQVLAVPTPPCRPSIDRFCTGPLARRECDAFVQVMVLQDSHIPIGCLPYLGQLRGLEEVTVNLARCADANQSTLEAALLRLCCTAPALQRVNMWNQVPRLGAVLERVRQALGSSGRRAVQLKCCGERCWIP